MPYYTARSLRLKEILVWSEDRKDRTVTVDVPDNLPDKLEYAGCRYGWILNPQELTVTGELPRDTGTEQFMDNGRSRILKYE